MKKKWLWSALLIMALTVVAGSVISSAFAANNAPVVQSDGDGETADDQGQSDGDGETADDQGQSDGDGETADD
ncbi:hypothetical protein, partial [Paenibacillus darwinianus]